jgi:hypothetical protein
MYGFLILVDPETSAYVNKDSPVERLTVSKDIALTRHL